MNNILRTGDVSRSLLALLCVGGGLVACTTQEVNGGTGGTTGSGVGGSSGQYATNDGVACPPVDPSGVITDFTYNADGGSMTSVHFGASSAVFSGDEYVYPTPAIASSVLGNAWHISGMVADYSGFGLSFDNCSRVDASAFKGISFTVSGTVAMGNTFTMGMNVLDDTVASSWLGAHDAGGKPDDPGRCIPTKGSNMYDQMDCANPTAVIDVGTPNQTVLWANFTGGKPKAVDMAVEAKNITSIFWYFPWAGASSTPYAVDITIDDLKFIP